MVWNRWIMALVVSTVFTGALFVTNAALASARSTAPAPTATFERLAVSESEPTTSEVVQFTPGVSLTNIILDGPTSGEPGTPYTYTAAIVPTNAERPVTVTLTTTGLLDATQVVLSAEDEITATFGLQWATPGTKLLTVTASNALGTITATETVSLTEAGVPVAPADIVVSGPSTGFTDVPYDFTAVVSPTNATTPMTYTWNVDSLPDVVVSDTATINEQTFTWEITGTRQITVTADNGLGQLVSDTTSILISETMTMPQPVTDVAIDGPASGETDTTYTYTVTFEPLDAERPLTVTLSTDDQTPQQTVITSDDEMTTTFALQWATPGSKPMTATASNSLDTVTATQTVEIISATESVALTDIMVDGPMTGTVGMTYTFTAMVSPDDATTPILYVWDADELVLLDDTTDELTNAVGLRWETVGTKAITVSAFNDVGLPVTATTTIVITDNGDPQPVPLSGVTVSGPASGIIGEFYTFSAEVSPDNAATPITYTWQADDQPELISSPLASTQGFTWEVTGTKTITLTADNGVGDPVQDTTTIVINEPPPPVALTGVTVSGPASGNVDTDYTFTATASPDDATTPVTFTWQADNQATIGPLPADGLSESQSFTWELSGTKMITVTADNGLGEPVQDTLTITITSDVVPVAPESLTISGNSSGELDTSYRFTARVAPENTTTPLNYSWQADGQEPVNDTGTLSNTQRFTWATSGTQTLTVTAANELGTVSNTFQIDIRAFSRVITVTSDAATTFEPAAGVRIEFPAGSFTDTTTVEYTPTTVTTTPPPDGTIARRLNLSATNAAAEPITRTEQAYSVAVEITADELEELDVGLADLQAYAWTGSAWEAVTPTVEGNMLTFAGTFLGDIVLLAPDAATNVIYLPRIVKAEAT